MSERHPRIFVLACDLLEVVVTAKSPTRAEYAVRGVAADATRDDLHRVLALLLVQGVLSSTTRRDEARAWVLTVRTRLRQARERRQVGR